jgi:hypothetical protein
MIAQPAVALLGEYRLQTRPGVPPPPVQQAILDGLDGSSQAKLSSGVTSAARCADA